MSGGRLIPDHVESALRRSITQRGQYAVMVDASLAKWRAEQAARPWYRKIWDRPKRAWAEARWRTSKAWAHLRGIECPTDY